MYILLTILLTAVASGFSTKAIFEKAIKNWLNGVPKIKDAVKGVRDERAIFQKVKNRMIEKYKHDKKYGQKQE